MDNIIDYVTNTPSNSNPNVLRDMLQTNSGSGGSGGNIMVIRPANVDKEISIGAPDSTTYVNVNMTITYDKTWQEVYDALAADIPVYLDITAIKTAKFEEEFFNTYRDDSGEIWPTYAMFKDCADHTVVKLPVVSAEKHRTYGNLMDAGYAITTAVETYGEGYSFGTGIGGGPNDPLVDTLETSFRKPDDYPEPESEGPVEY